MLEIVTWKDADRVADLATFIAATRPGYELRGSEGLDAAVTSGFRIEHMEVPALAISSTDLRSRVAERRPMRYLTPEPVATYIAKRGLYRGEA